MTQKKASTSKQESGLATESARLRRQIVDQTEEPEPLKKAATYFAKNKNNTAPFILKRRDQLRLVRMIAVFGVSRSGYYALGKRCQYPSARQLVQQ